VYENGRGETYDAYTNNKRRHKMIQNLRMENQLSINIVVNNLNISNCWTHISISTKEENWPSIVSVIKLK
jgi:hypothetical protein